MHWLFRLTVIMQFIHAVYLRLQTYFLFRQPLELWASLCKQMYSKPTNNRHKQQNIASCRAATSHQRQCTQTLILKSVTTAGRMDASFFQKTSWIWCFNDGGGDSCLTKSPTADPTGGHSWWVLKLFHMMSILIKSTHPSCVMNGGIVNMERG